MAKASPKRSFGQIIGALLMVLAVIFLLVYFVLRSELEKRDIDLETEVMEKVELVRDTGSAVKDKLTAVTADSAESLEESADDILPDVDDFSGANDEAAEYFLD